MATTLNDTYTRFIIILYQQKRFMKKMSTFDNPPQPIMLSQAIVDGIITNNLSQDIIKKSQFDFRSLILFWGKSALDNEP